MENSADYQTTERTVVSPADLMSELSISYEQKLEEIPKMISEEGWTALHVAVIESNEDLISHLITLGAETTECGNDGRTTIHWSAFSDISYKAFELIAHVSTESSLDQPDRYGRTPLHYVCLNKAHTSAARDIHETVRKLQVLLDLCKNVEKRDIEGNTPLLLLCKNIHNFATGEEIDFDQMAGQLRKADFKSRSVCGVTLEMFMKRGANILTTNYYGLTPLHAACKANCVEMIRVLISELQSRSLAQEVNPNSDQTTMDLVGNTTDACGNTPMLSVFNSHTCKSLQYEMNDVFPWSFIGSNRLRFNDSLRPILKHMKSSVNKPKTASGSSVLHYATADSLCSSDVVKGLIGYGKADVKARNVLGKTAIHYAFLPDLTYNPIAFSDLLIENRKIKVNLLLQNGADLNAQDWCGKTPLHDAVLQGDVEFVELLIQNKADVHVRNKYGDSPVELIDFCEKDSEVISMIRNCLLGNTSIKEDLLTKSIDSGNTKVRKSLINRYHINPDVCAPYLWPKNVRSVAQWFQENPKKWTLSDEKIQDLLKRSKSNSLSNDASQNLVLSQIIELMKAVFTEVEILDQRFKVRLELSGSTREGTKVDRPDEFDVLCFLENFQAICKIEESERGYVTCKGKESDENAPFREFFDDAGFLNGSKLTSTFYCCIKKALGNSKIWTSVSGLSLDIENHEYEFEDGFSGILCLHLLYTDKTYRYMPVSVDLVPAIRKRGWWPSFARQEGELLSSVIKEQGCMIITKPRTEVTLSGESIKFSREFKVSVYLSECSILTSLPESIRDAYKLAKILVRETELYPPLYESGGEEVIYSREEEVDPTFLPSHFHPSDPKPLSFTSYILKNALFYELDEEQRNLMSNTSNTTSNKDRFSTVALGTQPDCTTALTTENSKGLFTEGETEKIHCPASSQTDVNKETPCSVTRNWTSRIFRRLLTISKSDEFLPYFLPTSPLLLKRRANDFTDIQETFYKLIIAILEGNYMEK